MPKKNTDFLPEVEKGLAFFSARKDANDIFRFRSRSVVICQVIFILAICVQSSNLLSYNKKVFY